MLYQQQENDRISNMYNFEVVNKTFKNQSIEVKMKNPEDAELKMVDRESPKMELGEDALVKGSFFIIIPKNKIKKNNSEVIIEVFSNGKLMDQIKTNFVGPVQM
jgi:hypothetical protein